MKAPMPGALSRTVCASSHGTLARRQEHGFQQKDPQQLVSEGIPRRKLFFPKGSKYTWMTCPEVQSHMDMHDTAYLGPFGALEF